MTHQPYRSTSSQATGHRSDGMAAGSHAPLNDRLDPSRAAAGVERWRRQLAQATGEEDAVGLSEPHRLLTMLKVFGSTRRFANLCLAYPKYAAKALSEGPSDVLAEAARDLSSLDEAIGGPEALHTALSAIKSRADIAIGIAELSGAWGISDATAARTDLAERLIETAMTWLVRSAVSRGELSSGAERSESWFAIAGGDFAHEDLAPLGPMELLIVYKPETFTNTQGRSVERAFIRIGTELREALEGKPGDFPIFTLMTPMGSGVSGAGLVETTSAVEKALAGEQNGQIRRWFAGARIVAGDRAAGGAFLEKAESTIWGEQAIFTEKTREALLKVANDPHADLRACADILRWSVGQSRPVFRTACASEVFMIAAGSGILDADLAYRLASAFNHILKMTTYQHMVSGKAKAHADIPADELQSIARLSGYADTALFERMLDGVRSEARNALLALLNGPHGEIGLYRPAEDANGHDAGSDIEKLKDLGFSSGANLATLLDGWAALCAANQGQRFAAIAPGLTTEFGETQHPDDAVRLFDRLIKHLPTDNQAFAERLGQTERRQGLVSALGNFGAAVEPLLDDEAGATMIAGMREFSTSAHDAPDGDHVEALGKWRAREIASCAVQLADGQMDFDTASQCLEKIHATTLSRLFEASRKRHGAESITLHQFEGPGYALPGAVSTLGFLCAPDDAVKSDETARDFVDRLEAIGSGFFAMTPNVAHRPGGVAGDLVPAHAVFRDYIQSEAVATDHLKLSRAQIIAGADGAVEASVKTLRAAVANPRRSDILFRDLDRARTQRMRRNGEVSLWNFDVIEGGFHDTDLIISTLIYRHAGSQPALQSGSISARLELMARAGLVSSEVCETLKAAHSFWSRLALARALACWSDPQLAPVRKRFGAVLARAASVETFNGVRPIMRGYAEDVSHLYAQLVLGRPSLSLVANG